MRFLFKHLFHDDNITSLSDDKILKNSLYYDLSQANTDLRLFDENGGVVDCLLGEENKDNLILRYLLSQAIMNVTNNHNFTDREALLQSLMQENSFEELWKIFLDLTQYASLLRLFEQGDMFEKLGLHSDIFSFACPDINSDEFSSNSKFYFDEEKCNWVTEKMVVTNDSIKICKMPGYSFFERDVFCYDDYNPLMILVEIVGNMFFKKLLTKYFLKHFFILFLIFYCTPMYYLVFECTSKCFFDIMHYYAYERIYRICNSVIFSLLCIILRFYIIPIIWEIFVFVFKIVFYIVWYPIKYCIVEPVKYILWSTLKYSLTYSQNVIFIACIYFIIFILLLHNNILISLESLKYCFTQCVSEIYAIVSGNKYNGYIKISDAGSMPISFNLFLKFLSFPFSVNTQLSQTFFKDNKLCSKPNGLNINDFNIFHKFIFFLSKWVCIICNFVEETPLIDIVVFIFGVVTVSILLIIIAFLSSIAIAEQRYKLFRSAPGSIYDIFFHDVLTVLLLEGMHKKKCSIENFIYCIKSFLSKCDGEGSVNVFLSDSLKYKNNFMTTFDLWKKREYGQIKYNYSENVTDNVSSNVSLNQDGDVAIGNTDIALGNMFRYLDKCNSFNIGGENIYEKYTMSEILAFLDDYVMFFYYFIHSYNFFKSAIKDIYKIGIYFYPVYLSKHKGFCTANFEQGGGNGDLSLNIKDSKNIFLGDKCIPNNIEFDSNCQNIIFNGTNGSGKTIFLSQAILNVILAQSLGIAYANSYKGGVIDKVVTNFSLNITIDIFKSKVMQEYSNMDRLYLFTKKKGNRKKILFALDEICSGTDPEAGDMIVKKFLIEVMQLGGHVIAATHYFSPRKIEEEYPLLRCHNYTFNIRRRGNDGEVIYEYKVKRGVPEFSFAFAIMKTMSLNKQISEDFYNIFEKKETV